MQGIQSDTNTVLVAFIQSERAIQKERVAVAKAGTAFPEASYADLRALQITQQANITTASSRSLAEVSGPFPMFICTAVREIKPRDIKA